MDLYLSLGHGNGDPGAVVDGAVTERDELLAVLAPAISYLADIEVAIEVPEYPNTDGDTILQRRLAWLMARAKKDDRVVEFHLNAAADPRAHGCEVYYRDQDDAALYDAARLSRILSTLLDVRNRGAKPDVSSHHGRLAICRGPWRGLVVECGFLTNRGDRHHFRRYGRFAAVGAICHWLGV